MPGGGDECIRNSLVCKTVSMNSKYRGAVTCDVTPVFRVAPRLAACIRAGYPRGQRTWLRPPCPPVFGAWYQAWLEPADENGSLEVSGIPEDPVLCHMKTTPDDSAQLPGATEEIVLAEGVGPASPPLVGKQRVVSAACALQPVGTLCPNSCGVQAGPCF